MAACSHSAQAVAVSAYMSTSPIRKRQPPKTTRQRATVGSYGEAFSYERGTPGGSSGGGRFRMRGTPVGGNSDAVTPAVPRPFIGEWAHISYSKAPGPDQDLSGVRVDPIGTSLHGYLAYKKPPPLMTLQQDHD